jgi:hypothetical protein
MHLSLGPGGQQARIPIAPGLIKQVPIRAHRVLEMGDEVELAVESGTIALDGEREVETRRGRVRVRLSPLGPWTVDVGNALAAAAKRRLFLEGAVSSRPTA